MKTLIRWFNKWRGIEVVPAVPEDEWDTLEWLDDY